MIFERSARISIECLKGNFPNDSYIMIAKQASEIGYLSNLLDYSVGIWPIAYKIAQTPGLVYGARIVQHCFQRGVVCMNIRNDKNTHFTPTKVQPVPK